MGNNSALFVFLKKWMRRFFDDNIKDNIENLPILILLLFFIFWIKEAIKNLFDTYIVNPFLSEFLNYPIHLITFFFYILAWSFFSYSLFTKSYRNSFRVSFFTLTLFFFLILFWVGERFFWRNYTHLNLGSEFSQIKFITILDPIFLSLSALWIVLFKNSVQWSTPQIKSSWISSDSYLENIREDKLNREAEMKNFVSLLEELPDRQKSSFVIGISGSWGYGKTSFVQMAKSYLLKNSIIVEFNPWISSGTSNLTEDFFKTLDDEISKYIQTRNTILRYGKSLSKIGNSSNLFKFSEDLMFSDPPLKERFNQVSSLINKLDKRVFVLIDDLDRLDNSEVFEVLRLVRNTASFPNFIFIMAYDRNYLINALTNLKLFNPGKYLEKIIQFEIVLPRISSQLITNRLAEIINSGIDKIFENQLIVKESFKKQVREIVLDWSDFSHIKKPKYNLRFTISQVLLSFRDLKRFSNSFIFFMKNHHDKVYLPDLFILELLKFLNPELFVRLFNNDYCFQTKTEEGIMYYEPYTDNLNKEGFIKPGYKLDDVLKDFFPSPPQLTLIEELFSLPNQEDFNSKFALTYLENFNFYFSLFLEPNQVSFKDIEDFVKGVTKNPEQNINDWFSDLIRDDKVGSILEKLQFDYQINNITELGNYLAILLTLIERSNFEVTNNIFLRKVINKSFDFLDFEKGKEQLFEIIYEKSVFPFFNISTIINNLISSHIYKKTDEEMLRERIPSKEFLGEINLKLLKKYFIEVRNEDLDFGIYIILFYNCLEEIESGSNKMKIFKNASNFLGIKLNENKYLLENYLSYFLRFSDFRYTVSELNSERIGTEPFFVQIFGSQEKFIGILRKNNSIVSKEILKFFKMRKINQVVRLKDLNRTISIHRNLN